MVYMSSNKPLSEEGQMKALILFNEVLEPYLGSFPTDVQVELLALAATHRLFAMKDVAKADKWRNVLVSMFQKLRFGTERQ